MSETATQPVVLEGRGRLLPSAAELPARVTLGEADFTLAIGTDTRLAGYRDLATIAVQLGTTLLILGNGSGAEPFLLAQFGEGQARLIRELRERRLRQQMGDALMQAPTANLELLEYEAADERGVALIAYHPWGAVLAPIDERLPWIRIRRSALAAVTVDESGGLVAVSVGDASCRVASVALPRLGDRARLHGDRLTALRRAALDDAGRVIAGLMPDADYGARQEAAHALVDGRAARPADLPQSWANVEAAVLGDPTFAASYHALVERAGAAADLRSIAMAPVAPGADQAKSWFFVALPGNLVALELVSEGAHATYCFRVEPRSEYDGGPPSGPAVEAAVRDVSEALVDSRFLREPMALPDEQLRQPANLRYRLALRALPSLAAARQRFVARIVHRDDVSWAAAIDALIAWHATEHDDAAVWPGRATQEALVDDAGAADPSTADAGVADGPDAADAGDTAAIGVNRTAVGPTPPVQPQSAGGT